MIKKSLRRKISGTIITVVLVSLLCVSAVFFIAIRRLASNLIQANQEMSRTSGQMSSASMTSLTQTRLRELADDKANIVDSMFLEFQQAVCVAASTAERIYEEADSYPRRPVELPDPEKDGTLSLQVLYASGVNPEDEKIKEEVELLGNVQDTLFALNSSLANMASIYIASESGFMIQADYISAKKYDSDGKLLPMNAKTRPWYQGAKSYRRPYFTPVVKDVHTPRRAIMCGVPVVVNSRLMGVAGAGMYLDNIDSLVHSVDLGEHGDVCIVNRQGQVLFSTYEEGSLTALADRADLRASENGELAEMASRSAGGAKGVELVEIDGIKRYVAYTPMKTVGWSLWIILSQGEVEAPVRKLMTGLDQITDQAVNEADRRIKGSALMLAAAVMAAVLAALLVSLALSRRIVRPIRKLTDEVQTIKGDNLDFRCDLETGDETQLLADSFQSLTERMKTYIHDIETITAEKERIGAELELATRIQNSMLPHTFPPFPDRSEFDIYASMDPAREVGGDFYDFFLVDDDHLCTLVADVSGKGVPAALFMMASKIILQSFAAMGQSPGEILTKANEAICSRNEEEMFITVWLGILELSTGKLTAANAGHEYPVLKRNGGNYEIFRDKHGFVVGGMDGIRYKEYEIQLEPGAELFVYSDGVPEATNAENELFGMDRAVEALNSRPASTPEGVLENVREAVDRFVDGAEQFDDLTMLCLKYYG